jgi:hypothetical protein
VIPPQVCFQTRNELQTGVQSYLADPSANSSRSQLYGWPINEWCLGDNVTDLSFLFAGAASFNEPLEGWNITNVINFSGMFEGAVAFRQNLCPWGLQLSPLNSFRISFDSMFAGTSCANTSDPSLLVIPPGPFCEPCA